MFLKIFVLGLESLVAEVNIFLAGLNRRVDVSSVLPRVREAGVDMYVYLQVQIGNASL
jgi:hypothetical protein